MPVLDNIFYSKDKPTLNETVIKNTLVKRYTMLALCKGFICLIDKAH